MPRAAVLSLHARVDGVQPAAWEHPSLVQLWGPRYHTYVVAASDFAVFSLGRLPDDAKARLRAETIAAQLHAHLDGERMTHAQAGQALGVNPNLFKYAAATGTVAIRWDGARAPTIWTVAAPRVDPADARRELGPALSPRLRTGRVEAASPAGQASRAARPPPRSRRSPGRSCRSGRHSATSGCSPATSPRCVPRTRLPRLLGCSRAAMPYFLLDGAERELLVPDADQRARLWTSRVWPGALLVDGEVRGTWRRSQGTVAIDAWNGLPPAARDAIEAEAATLPLPGLEGRIVGAMEHVTGREIT